MLNNKVFKCLSTNMTELYSSCMYCTLQVIPEKSVKSTCSHADFNFVCLFYVYLSSLFNRLNEMPQSYGNDISLPLQNHNCECYKKLQAFGIPLYITDENELYSENQKVIPYENAFQLPGFLKINESVTSYPVIEDSELSYVFEKMVQILPNLSDYEQNVLSFWILDMFIEGLWTAQTSKMNHGHQKATLLWIAYFFNYIQKNNPSRRELFRHLKTVLFQSDCVAESIGEVESKSYASVERESEEANSLSRFKKSWMLPLPPVLTKTDNELRFSSDEQSTMESESEEAAKSSISSTSDWKKEENGTEINLKHMNIILKILYRIFARLWVYLEIQTVFHAMPPVEQVDLPFTLGIPKPLYKPEPSNQIKLEKGGKRPSLSEKSVDYTESERQLRKNHYILPLQNAEETKMYLKQFSGQPVSDRSVLNKNREERIKK